MARAIGGWGYDAKIVSVATVGVDELESRPRENRVGRTERREKFTDQQISIRARGGRAEKRGGDVVDALVERDDCAKYITDLDIEAGGGGGSAAVAPSRTSAGGTI